MKTWLFLQKSACGLFSLVSEESQVTFTLKIQEPEPDIKQNQMSRPRRERTQMARGHMAHKFFPTVSAPVKTAPQLFHYLFLQAICRGVNCQICFCFKGTDESYFLQLPNTLLICHCRSERIYKHPCLSVTSLFLQRCLCPAASPMLHLK